MARQFISQLGDRDDVHEIFLVAEKQLRPNRNGQLYLQLRVSDRSGTVNAMMWNAGDKVYNSFENGDYIQIIGSAQVYNGNLQIIVNELNKAEADDVNEADFVQMASTEIEKLSARLAEMLRSMENLHLKNLAECFLMDEQFQRRFNAAPAGVKNHHAYPGGLLQHVVSLMELVLVVAPRYEALNNDLMLMGAFLHDVGKIEELTYDRALGYSDAGQLIGHLVQGVLILETKIAEASELMQEPFPNELTLQLQHLIVSHHGRLEFGSPKVPMTLEAVALNFLDDLDAKIFTFEQLIREDVNTDSNWTVYNPALGRKIFKTI